MDLLAGIFSFILVALSAGITYHWGIKPDRERKKRRAERALAETRRRQYEKFRKRPTPRGGSITHANSGEPLHQRGAN
jgi:hypothetical protein